MHRKHSYTLMSFVFLLILVSLACATSQPTPAFTNTPGLTATETAVPTATKTARPSPTPRPTQTPNLAATERAVELNAEVQEYFDRGYVITTEGRFTELDNYSDEYAYLGAYKPPLVIDSAGDFFLSAHFRWSSALENSDAAGCGFIFGLQPNFDHYAVFLDRTKVEFRIRNLELGYSTRVKPTRATGRVNFAYPAEADFTLILKGANAFVLVNGEVIGEYTLLQGRSVRGDLGLTVLSGTNKDYGTRCEMTNLHLWLPKE